MEASHPKPSDELKWRSPTYLTWSFSTWRKGSLGHMHACPLLSIYALWSFLSCVLNNVFRCHASLSLQSGQVDKAEVLGPLWGQRTSYQMIGD